MMRYKEQTDRLLDETKNMIEILIRQIETKAITDKDALFKLKVIQEKVTKTAEMVSMN